jgi:ParB-like chromosome segregation protein Spo0J
MIHQVAEISLADIYPNPWNPNMTSARVDDAIRESIKNYGFVQPLIVRHHPVEIGKYEIIDGEHRFEASLDLGIEKLPCVVLEVGDLEAKRLTIIANETRGRAETIPLAELLDELTQGLEEPLTGLPYYEADVEEILAKASRISAQQLKIPDYYSRVVIKYPPTGHSDFLAELRQWLREKYPEVILVT